MTRPPGPDHAAWADATGAYLLDALEPDERAGYVRHLDECPACADEIAELRVAVQVLPASVEPLAPPPALKGRIMAVVEAEAKLLEAAGPRADLPEPRARRSWLGRFALRPGFALAGATALIVLGAVGGILLDGGDGPGGSKTRTVAAEVSRGDASARLLVGEDDSRLEVARLAEPPRGRVYQVWTKRPGAAPEPTRSLFVPRSDGSASVAVPGALEGVEQVLVTDEPVGGSDAPTRTPFLAASPDAS